MVSEERVETRPTEPEDEDFLFELFAATRGAALAASGLPTAMVETLVRGRWAGQRMSYREQSPDADHRILQHDGRDVGASIVDRSDEEHRIVDIVISPESRNRGLGRRWLMDRLSDAVAAGVPVRLSVEIDNAGARALYDQLGFEVVGSTPTHLEMERSPD